VKVTMSARVWNSYTEAEQAIVRHFAGRYSLPTIKAFISDMRTLGGSWAGGWFATQGGRTYLWRGEDSRGFITWEAA
jgi:hypothetical protein